MRSQSEIEHIKNMLPVFKTRAMRRAAFRRFERLTPKLSSVAFNYMYKELTGDQSAATNIDQAEIEKRVKMIVDMEDLRHLKSGRKGIYDVFLARVLKVYSRGCLPSCRRLQTSRGNKPGYCNFNSRLDIAGTVDKLNYVYVLPSISGLIYVEKSINKSIAHFSPLQVSKQCPKGTPIPSVSWVRLQFWPKKSTLAFILSLYQ